MLRIRAVVLREVHLPLKEPFRISSGSVENRRLLLLELESDEGATTWSECVAPEAPYYTSEALDTAWVALSEWLIPPFLREVFGHPAEVDAFLSSLLRGHRMARAGLEMGAWGVEAARRGVPLAQLLVEGRGAPREWLDVGISLGLTASPEALAERAVREAAAGYRKIKLKIRPGADVAYVAAVRRALPSTPLMVDANAAYAPVDAAALLPLDAYDLTMIEQPLDGEDLLRHADLQARLRTPLCLDESITGLDRTEDMIRLRSARIVNIKPGRVGGFTPALAIHDRCAAAAIPVWCGGMLESGIGRSYNVALACLPNFTLPGDLSPSARYWAQDLVNPEWTMTSEGQVRVPLERPGLGVEVDRDRILALTVRTLRLER
jgi:o-succinylbenzoate synthase